jgi:hypothetical protein
MRQDIELSIETDDIYLTVTYDCDIRRVRNSDDHHKWWEPEVKSTLVHALLYYGDDNEEIEWRYGDNKPAVLVAALERYDGQLDEMLEDEITEIINDINFTHDPNEGEPRDD